MSDQFKPLFDAAWRKLQSKRVSTSSEATEVVVWSYEISPPFPVVERTFAWLGRYHRLSKDYEACTDSSENLTYIAMIQLMLHRLVPY